MSHCRRLKSRGDLSGETSMTIENGTGYLLHLYLSGPVSRELTLARGFEDLRVAPGDYEVAAKVANASVHPFYGKDVYSPNSLRATFLHRDPIQVIGTELLRMQLV